MSDPFLLNIGRLPQLSRRTKNRYPEMDEAGLAQVERQRSELEEHISKLRKALRHWQTWEIEYEGLREEIASLPNGSDTDDVLAIARDFQAESVDYKELRIIIGGEGRSVRTQAQIVDLLAKRVDYVSRNARTIEKQLTDAQKKRNALLLAEEPDFREDSGLPLTDIAEELDDEGNIVSSSLKTPESAAPQLVDVLKKAGVEDLFERGGVVTASKGPSSSVNERRYGSPREKDSATEILSRKEVATEQNVAIHERSQERQHDGGLGLDKDLTELERRANGEYGNFHNTLGTGDLTSTEARSARNPAGQVSISSQTSGVNSGEDHDKLILPTAHPNDTPEQAALRQEMLQYGLGEVGAIVAELDLIENEGDVSCDDDEAALSLDSDLDEDEVEDEDESEDETGMVKHPTMSGRYLEKMKKLEEKHNIKGMQNQGSSELPKAMQNELQRPAPAEAAQKAGLAREAFPNDSAEPTPRHKEQESSKPRKKVAFAEDLNIQPETRLPTPLKKAFKDRPQQLNLVEPVKESVVERQSSTAAAHTTQSSGHVWVKKPSRFKAAREATPQTPLLPPSPTSLSPSQPSMVEPKPVLQSKTIFTDDIVEHDINTKPIPPDPNGLVEAIHRQEIAGEYYKLRNRMIQRQGGFVGEGEADNYGEEITPPPIIGEDGKEKKISRFKAARLK